MRRFFADATAPELTSRDHAATQMFLYNRTLFQGEHLPPSNAVLPTAPHQGYWTARKGRTTFPFNFRLPTTAPSSVVFAGNASLRYSLKATIQVWYNDDRTLVTSRKDAFVVEKWEDENDEKYLEPRDAVADTRLFMGGTGAVWLEAGVPEVLFWGGGSVTLRCGVKNNTKRTVSGVRVALARKLIFPVGNGSKETSLQPQITDIVHQEDFKGPSFDFAPGNESVFNVAVEVPRDLRTIRKTRLFEVRIFALVSVMMGTFAKDLTVELPIFVAHGTSVRRAAQLPTALPSDLDAQMHAVQQFALERGWSPAPVMQMQLPARAASSMAGKMIAIPATPQPFMVDQNMIALNPESSGWGASSFHVPNSAFPIRPASAMQTQRSFSAGPELQQQLHAVKSHFSQQLSQPVAFAAPSVHTLAGHGVAPQQSAVVRRASAPSVHENQVALTHSGVHDPMQAIHSVAPHTAPSPSPSPSPSPATYQPIATLPPPPTVPLGLATITEDSESQAGTVKSVNGLKFSASVSKSNIAQFEALADLAENKSQGDLESALAEVGLKLDEQELRRQDAENPQSGKILPKAPMTSKSDVATAVATNRPRASDLF